MVAATVLSFLLSFPHPLLAATLVAAVPSEVVVMIDSLTRPILLSNGTFSTATRILGMHNGEEGGPNNRYFSFDLIDWFGLD
jgi:hypothetical protein